MDYDELDMPKVIRLNRGWLSYLAAAVLFYLAADFGIRPIVLGDTELLPFSIPTAMALFIGAVFGLLQTRYDRLTVRPRGMTIRRFLWRTVIDYVSWDRITGILWHGGIGRWFGNWEFEYEDESGHHRAVLIHTLSRRSYERVQHLTGAIIQRCALSEKSVPHIPWWHLWRPRPKRIWR